MNAEPHRSVLLEEVLTHVRCVSGGTYVDATVGEGGHASALLQRYAEVKLVAGIDCDEEAVERARKKLSHFSKKALVLHGNFGSLATVLTQAGIDVIDGIIFDLGVSTAQLKNPLRGFSFQLEGGLDMRMNRRTALQAKDVLERSEVGELASIIRRYGEERWAHRIARAIKDHLAREPIHTTTTLSSIITKAIPVKHHPRRIHPATKTFQALRIVVNDELAALKRGLHDAVHMLRSGGRICVISFHSLEDRVVKTAFNEWAKECVCPPGFPVCTCSGCKHLNVITKKPIMPGPDELSRNRRARSARLRVAERV